MQMMTLRRISLYRAASVLVLCAVLLSMSAVPALAQSSVDPAIDRLIESGLATVVDQSSEFDGVQMTVQYAYADTQRLIVRVKLSGDYEDLLEDHMREFLLRDDTARRFGYRAALPVEREDDEVAEVYDVIFYNQTTFELPDDEVEIINGYLDDYGDTIDLQLTVAFTPMSALGRVLSTADLYAMSPVGPFDFVFTVPIHRAVVFMPELSVSAAGVDMELARVAVAPSETEIELCYTLPDGQDWQPVASLSLAGEPALMSGASFVALPDPADSERCVRQNFAAFAGNNVSPLVVTVERLQTSVPDDPDVWAGFAGALAEFGIEAEAFAQPHTYFTIVSTPEGMTDAELAEIIDNAREDLRATVEGPWVFEVGVP